MGTTSVTLVVAFAVALVGGFVLVTRRFRRPHDAGERLLAGAAPDATVLFVDRERVWRPDGATVAVLRSPPARAQPSPPEPEPRPETEKGAVPGPGAGQRQPSGGARPESGRAGAPLLDGVRWLWYNPSGRERVSVARGPDGAVLFMIDRIPTGWDLPETAVRGPDGGLRATIRRTVRHPVRLTLLDRDGAALGSVASTGSGDALLALYDADGRRVGAVARGRHRRVLVLEPGGAALRDVAIAFTIDMGRLNA